MKNKNAFTLFEVLLSLVVLTSAVYIISNLQTRALFKVLGERDEIEKTFRMKKDLYLNFFNPPEEGKKVVNKIENEDVSFTTQPVEIDVKSQLVDMKKNVKIIKTDALWKFKDAMHEDSMVSFIYQPPKEKEKNQ